MIPELFGTSEKVGKALPSRLLVTSAAPSKELLSVVTLSWNGHHLYLVPSMTTFFELAADDQAGVRAFASEVWQFFADRGISAILVKRGPAAGPRAAAPASAKMETVLQLLPIPCVQIHIQRISSWVRQEEWLLPQSQTGLYAKARELQELAIDTAAFGVAAVLES